MTTFLEMMQRMFATPNRASEAPSAPVNNAQRRRNRINPRLPRAGEGFADYTRRVGAGDRTLASTSNTGEALRQEQRDSAAAVGERAIDRADRDASPTPGQELAEIVREGINAGNMRLSDIPMGVETAFPRMTDPALPTRGGRYVSGARYGNDGWPTEMQRDAIDWASPARRQGMIQWGVDLRRPEADVLADVERVAGAPAGMLNMISMRESDMSRRQYDQGGPDSTSAQGPHQFTEGTFKTWATGTGARYGIPTAGLTREELQGMRYDIRVSGAMTAEMARYHASLIQNANPEGPAASVAEIYLMHHGGEEALGLVNAVRQGKGDTPAVRYYSAQAVRNHMSDYYVRGDPSRPRTARQFFDWMTGNDPNSPHQRNYDGGGLRGLPTEPAQFGARADGSTDVARVMRPGVVGFEGTRQ